jgi:hypothetical protein
MTRDLQQALAAHAGEGGAEAGGHYGRYEFHVVVQKLQNFCSEDLGGFYLDVLKDRLYTTPADSRARRSAQNALYHIAQALTRLFAPILSFTAQEVWETLNGGAESVFEQTWHEFGLPRDADQLRERWGRLLSLRSDVLKQLEELRAARSSARRSPPRWSCTPTGPSGNFSGPSMTISGSYSSPRGRSSSRRRRRAPAPPRFPTSPSWRSRARTRNVSAAGIIGPTSAGTRSIRRCAVAASPISLAVVSPARMHRGRVGSGRRPTSRP